MEKTARTIRIKKVFLIFLLMALAFLPAKCAGEQVKYKIAMHKANKIVKMYEAKTLTYGYVIQQFGEPWIKTQNAAEFFIKPDSFIGIAYTSLVLTFDEYGNIETAMIVHSD